MRLNWYCNQSPWIILFKEWIFWKKFIIESDFASVVIWMNKHPIRPLKYHDLFISTSCYAVLLDSVSCFHVLREANHMADNLAKQEVTRVNEFLAWFWCSSLLCFFQIDIFGCYDIEGIYEVKHVLLMLLRVVWVIAEDGDLDLQLIF